jgi:hypothetical protein
MPHSKSYGLNVVIDCDALVKDESRVYNYLIGRKYLYESKQYITVDRLQPYFIAAHLVKKIY